MSLKKISMTDLYRISSNLSSTEAVLDVRTAGEFAAGHIKGSIHIPHDQIQAHIDSLRNYKLLYIHCRSGARAATAADTLAKAGLTNVVCVSGSGMEDWIASGFPFERGK